MEKLKLTAIELRDIVYEDSDEFEVIEKEITDTWRHGNENLAIIKRLSDGKYFEVYYRTSPKENCEFEDMNFTEEYDEIEYYVKADSNDDMVSITKKEYESILKDVKFMRALEAAGVDNWEGYNIAIDILESKEN